MATNIPYDWKLTLFPNEERDNPIQIDEAQYYKIPRNFQGYLIYTAKFDIDEIARSIPIKAIPLIMNEFKGGLTEVEIHRSYNSIHPNKLNNLSLINPYLARVSKIKTTIRVTILNLMSNFSNSID